MKFRPLALLIVSLPLMLPAAEVPAAGNTAPTEAAGQKDAKHFSPELKAALEKLKLPGVKINIDQWAVDVDSKVCLREGLLELIACTKDTKEHESIIMVEAKPSHIHTALLLLGARPGNPASQRMIEGQNARIVSIPPSGNPVDVFLVIKDDKGVETQHPISDFIVHSEHNETPAGLEGAQDKEARKFPADPFLFAGSVLVPAENGTPRRYVCDETGDVISISTFGDELLCMSGINGQDNESLAWQVNGDKLPEVGGKIILRLKPRIANRPGPAPAAK